MEIDIKLIDEIDDALWEFIQLTARKIDVKNLSNDEFNNEMIAEVRNLILGNIKLIKDYREEN